VKRRAPRYDIPKAAPRPLRLIQEFVNTVDHEHGREWLATPAALRDWFVERRLLPPGARVRRVDLEQARTFRAALRQLVVAGDHEVDRQSVATLEAAARAADLTFRVDSEGATLVPEATGVTGALGRLLIVFFEASLDGSWQRLKACPNCKWAFYDYSKNRSATWCSMRLCGNRTKTRSYYRRQTDRRRRNPA
jgi:Putative stress-induced transcription regulator/CGNR zinc finger